MRPILLFILLNFAASVQADVKDQPLQTSGWDVDSGHFDLRIGWWPDETKSEDVLAGIVSFEPVADARSCQSIRFIQVARVKDNHGSELNWPGRLSDRNRVRTDGGHFIDADNSRCDPGTYCSPYFNDYWPDKDYSRTGENTGRLLQPAGMADFPFGWTEFASIRLETCAVCADDDSVYGCVHWGATWPESGTQQFARAFASASPTVEFRAALAKFRAFYGAATQVSLNH